jgi:hypothetical protein
VATADIERPSALRVVDGLVDTGLERTLAAILVVRPELLHEHSDPRFGIDCLADFHAVAVVTAVANLLARHSVVDAKTIAAELESRGMQSIDAWYPALVARCPDVIRPDAFRTQTSSLVRLAAKRRGAVADAEADPVEAEVDEFALRDTEAPDPWAADVAQARKDVDRILGAASLHERKPLFGLDAIDLLRASFPPAQWLVTGLITTGGTVVAAGEPKAGIKTWMLIEIAVAIATGTKAFGEFFSVEGRVAVFFAEDQAQSVRNRVRATLAGGNRTLAANRLLLQPRGEFVDILKDDDLAWLVASCRRLGKLDLLVLDPLRDIHSGEEDKSDSMRDVMRRLRVLGEILGCTVAVSHHVPKQTKDNASRRPGQNLRGSSAIHGSIDSGMYITPGEGDGTTSFGATVISQVKNARSAGAFGLELAITDDENGEATCATWAFDCEARAFVPKSTVAQEQRSSREAADDQKLFEYVKQQGQRGQFLSQAALRKVMAGGGSDYRARRALERLIKGSRLFVHEGVIRYPGWEDSDA